MVTISYCDKCGKQLGGLKVSFLDIQEIPCYAISRGLTGKLYFCPKCNKDLSKWLKN